MVEVSHLTKRYGPRTAISDLCFTIESGRIYGFLGPNGAGKSTTMNIITGCLAATEGSVTIGGHDIFEEPVAAKKLVGYLPEQPPLYQDMTPREYLAFVLEAKGVKGAKAQGQMERVVEITGIGPVKDRLIRNLSKGYKQRVGLAQALTGEPQVVVLDEPTVGLDPKQIIEIRDLIRQLGDQHTVVLSSHILSEVSQVCDQILIIDQGRLVANGTPQQLSQMLKGGQVLSLLVKAGEAQARAALREMPGLDSLESAADPEGTLLRLHPAEGADLREAAFTHLSQAGLVILEMKREQATLEDVFLQLTEEKEGETA